MSRGYACNAAGAPFLTLSRQQSKVLDEVVKLRQIFREASVKGTGFLDYGEALNAARCLVMGCFWTFDNLAYLTTTQTVNFGAERAQKGFSRSYTVSSALYILLGIESLRLVRYRGTVPPVYKCITLFRPRRPFQASFFSKGFWLPTIF